MKKIIFFFILFNIILNNNETKNLNNNNSFNQNFSSSSEDEHNSHTFITLLIVLISLIILVVILFIFYKFYLNSYIERNKIPNFKTTNIFELKKHYLFQKLMNWKYYKKDEEEVCPICLQKFNKNISKICITPCKHIFHFYCLKKFVFEFNNLNCPYCKKEYLPKKKFNLHGVIIIPLDEKDNPIYELQKNKNFEKNEKPIDSETDLNNNKNIEENINNNVNNNSNDIENN